MECVFCKFIVRSCWLFLIPLARGEEVSEWTCGNGEQNGSGEWTWSPYRILVVEVWPRVGRPVSGWLCEHAGRVHHLKPCRLVALEGLKGMQVSSDTPGLPVTPVCNNLALHV